MECRCWIQDIVYSMYHVENTKKDLDKEYRHKIQNIVYWMLNTDVRYGKLEMEYRNRTWAQMFDT